MITFSDIVARAPQKDAFDPSVVWSFRSMLEGLEHEGLGTHDDLDDELINAIRAQYAQSLTVHTVFDVMHDSDECCRAEVLCLNGAPILLFKRIGDRSDYRDGVSILRAADAAALLRIMAEHRIERALKNLGKDADLEDTENSELLWRNTNYLTPVANGVFCVNSPKWACSFAHIFDDHAGYLLDGSGNLIRVLKFVGWVNEIPSYVSGHETSIATFQTEAGERVADARNVLFTLTGDRDELESAAKDIARDAWWCATSVHTINRSNAGLMHLAQSEPGCVHTKHFSLMFNDQSAMQSAFDILRTPQAGQFDRNAAVLVPFQNAVDWQRSDAP